MILSMSFAENADPSRIASQVAAGMGFLGAGTIIRHRSGVRGLTTAASLWAVAAIGLCVGRGESGYMIAVSTTAFVFITLRGLSWVEKRMLARKRQYHHATLRMRRAREVMARLEPLIDEYGARIQSCDISEPYEDGVQEVRMALRLPADLPASRLTPALTSQEEVLSVEWD
jgi:putative Mg2+ transporter-C (MgtC) family protein